MKYRRQDMEIKSPQLTILEENITMNTTAINQLLCAAMVSKNFCQALLDDPAKAVDSGYLGHDFFLTEEQGNFISSIQAQSFEEFAQKVYDWISSNIYHNNGILAPQDRQIARAAGPFSRHELEFMFEVTPYEPNQYQLVPLR